MQSIAGFHQDDSDDWVADLACGHTQHTRHRPPLESRPWTLTEAGREAQIGQELECKLCRMPKLPEDLELVSRTTTWTQHTLPQDMVEGSRLEPGTWARLIVEEGYVLYQVHGPDLLAFPLNPDVAGIVPPQTTFRLRPQGTIRVHQELWEQRPSR